MEKTATNVSVSEPKVNAMRHLKIYNKQDVLSLTRLRRFETKLGERLQIVNNTGDIEKSLAVSTAKYVLFGIPEDLGAKGKFWYWWGRYFMDTLPAKFFEYSK
jgi:formiminoglutamase